MFSAVPATWIVQKKHTKFQRNQFTTANIFLSGFSLMLSDMLLDVINLNIKCLMIDCLYSHYI